MLKSIVESLRGIICLSLHILVILILSMVVFIAAALKFLIPIKRWRLKCSYFLNHIPMIWTDCNEIIMRCFTKLAITLIGAEQLKQNEWYLMTANHNSWSDVTILYRVFNHRIPTLRFFMKSQLRQIPIFGWACWLVGFPFMKRHTKAQLTKNPQLKGTDLITTKKLCSRFKTEGMPITIISFAEGTRYTKEKAERQQSPFNHLLKPRAGGLAYTLMVMGDCIHQFLDVTIVYPTGHYGFWDYLCGRIKQVIIKVDCYPIDETLLGDYDSNLEHRVAFQRWLNQLWEKKDAEIDILSTQAKKDSSCNACV